MARHTGLFRSLGDHKNRKLTATANKIVKFSIKSIPVFRILQITVRTSNRSRSSYLIQNHLHFQTPHDHIAWNWHKTLNNTILPNNKKALQDARPFKY